MTTVRETLGVIARADKRWAERHDLMPAEAAYLEHLAAAVNAHIIGKQHHRLAALDALVAAVLLDDYDPKWDVLDQAQEAVRIIRSVHTYLLGTRAQLAPHRPVEGAA